MSSAQRREKFRVGLSGLYLPIYDKLCADLPSEWAPFYGLRTDAQQDALYAIGRTLTPEKKTVTDAKAGESPHNYGCASDWILWDLWMNPIWMPPSDPRWKVYIDAIAKAGGRAGFHFSKVDAPHNELPITVSWTEIKAGRKIEECLVIQST